jgi:hypothetical protein
VQRSGGFVVGTMRVWIDSATRLRENASVVQAFLIAASFSLCRLPMRLVGTDRALAASHPSHRESDAGFTLDRL